MSLVQIQHPFQSLKSMPHVLMARRVDLKEPGGSRVSEQLRWDLSAREYRDQAHN